MPLFHLKTVRAKLILTTMVVISLLLVAVGVMFEVSARRVLIGSVDDDLERRGVDFAQTILKRGIPPVNPPQSPNKPETIFSDNGNSTGAAGSSVPLNQHVRQGNDTEWIAPLAVPVGSGANAWSVAYDFGAYERAAKGETCFTTFKVDGDPRRVFSTPVRIHGHIAYVVQIANSIGPALASLDRQRLMLLRVVVPLGLLLGAAASFFVVSQLLKPLRHITEEAERIGSEGFGEKLKSKGDDEFATLVSTLNGMLTRLENFYRIEQDTNRRLEETIDQQRRFTSDASHELKTPLAVMKAYLGVLKGSKNSIADESEVIQAMDEGANRMNSLIQDLLALARTDAGIIDNRAPCCIEDTIRKAIRLTPTAPERTTFLADSKTTVLGSEEELSRVFINLIDNAIKYSGSLEPIEVTIETTPETVVISIRDHGAGIPEKHLPHLCERFYRTDESRASVSGGSGLGLAICAQIIKSHGGEITVESKVGEGTCFTMNLPILHEVFK